MAQTVQMVTQPPSVPNSHVLSGYSTIDNSQIHPNMSMMVSSLVPTQTLVTSHSQNMPNGIVPPTTNPVGHLILQSPKVETGQREQEKRIRREIANSNERRRMQSINAGFKSLKTILPHTDGEKLSKAAILQQTSEYITQLESDKLKLMHQNEKLRRALSDCKCSSVKRRGLGDIFDKDEGIGSPAEEDFEDLRRGMLELRQQLDKERRMRIIFEEQARGLENQLYPERVQSMKLSSSDERRSSSECSPGASRPVISKPQTCARPLLPPLAPLPKIERTESAVYPTVPDNVTLTNPLLGSQGGVIQSVALPNSSCENNPLSKSNADLKAENASALKHEIPVTVFSHSTKSNQPLKKRAIEIHQSFVEGNEDSTTRQPNNKVAKISTDSPCIDHPPEIGTRSFLPPTLPPISSNDNAKSVPPMMHILPTSHLQTVSLPPSTIALPAPTVIPLYNPIPAQSGPLVMSPKPPVANANTVKPSMPIAPQELSRVTLATTNVSPATSLCTPQSHTAMPCSMGVGIDSKAIQLTTQEIMNAQQRLWKEKGDRNSTVPMYLTVGGFTQQAGVDHLNRKDAENTCQKVTSSATQPHFIVAPASTQCIMPIHNTIQNNALSRRKSEESARMTLQQHQRISQSMNAVRQAGSNIVPTTSVPVLPYNVPSNTIVPGKPAYESVQPHTPAFLHLATMHSGENKLVQDQNSQSPAQTILCHGQPEITLNQLNTMPNVLAQPRSLQQPVLQIPTLPFVVKQYGSNSPSYASPGLQDIGMVQSRPAYILPHSARCRKSSMSATDSCSTASVSGAEEEEIRNPLLEDPDSQTGDNVPTIKLSQSHSINNGPGKGDSSKSPPQQPGDEVSHDNVSTPKKDAPSRGVDVADSSCTAAETRLSVLSNPAGSPPVIRHIDAIQTRRNLETIVQAIDHLEQQERRNSQDRSEVNE